MLRSMLLVERSPLRYETTRRSGTTPPAPNGARRPPRPPALPPQLAAVVGIGVGVGDGFALGAGVGVEARIGDGNATGGDDGRGVGATVPFAFGVGGMIGAGGADDELPPPLHATSNDVASVRTGGKGNFE
jgi:hypothetical protein